MARASQSNVVAQNRKARRNYEIEDTFEAGIVLTGTEVKSLRLGGGCSINEAYAADRNGDFYLFGAHIPPYRPAGPFNHDPKRPRRLLLHRREINRLIGAVTRAGVTLVPLAIYFNERGLAKVRLGLGKGRKKVDKRHVEKEREWRRQKARLLREKG